MSEMTAGKALKLFMERKMSINIKGTSQEDMTMLQKIIGIDWRSGDKLDSPRLHHYTQSGYNCYISNYVDAYGERYIARSTQQHRILSMTADEFLGLFDISIKESEIEELFQ